jgi:hypothetical protein
LTIGGDAVEEVDWRSQMVVLGRPPPRAPALAGYDARQPRAPTGVGAYGMLSAEGGAIKPPARLCRGDRPPPEELFDVEDRDNSLTGGRSCLFAIERLEILASATSAADDLELKAVLSVFHDLRIDAQIPRADEGTQRELAMSGQHGIGRSDLNVGACFQRQATTSRALTDSPKF